MTGNFYNFLIVATNAHVYVFGANYKQYGTRYVHENKLGSVLIPKQGDAFA